MLQGASNEIRRIKVDESKSSKSNLRFDDD